MCLAEHCVLVGRQVDDAVRYDDINRVAFKGSVLHLGKMELHIGQAEVSRILTREVYHVRRHIDADDPALLADRLRGDEAVYAAAAAEVHYRLAEIEVADRGGIAAAR